MHEPLIVDGIADTDGRHSDDSLAGLLRLVGDLLIAVV